MAKAPEYVPIHTIHTKEMHALGFDVIDLEGKAGRAYDSSVPHRHTFFELFFFESGKGIHEIDFTHHPVAKNSVHFVSPGQIHKLILKNIRGYVLCFTEDFIPLKANENFIEKFTFYDGFNPPVLKLPPALSAGISVLVNALDAEFRSKGKGNTDILASYLTILLLKINTFFEADEKIKKQRTTGKNEKVRLFKNLINIDFLSHKPVSDYAAALNISPNHLNALCKKHEGRSAIQLIHTRLLLESKRLLYATDLTIKEISFQLKFEDVPYFNRFFKKQAHMPPLHYRRQFQKNR